MEWSRFFHRAKWDDERAKELADYLAQEIDDNIARGMNRDDATRAAHLQLGNTTRIREEIYEMNTLRLLDALWRDLRYGMRLLIRNPTFAVVAVLTLALGTGANAAIFQLVNAVRFRTLPVERPEELASVGIDHHGKGRIGRSYTGRPIHTEVIWDALRAEQQAFSSIAAWGSGSWDLSSEGEPQRINGFYVSGRFFETLGVRPHVGRLLTESDDKKGCGTSGAVLSYGFWQSRYGGNPGVVGQPIMLERRPFEIVGVAPPHFFGVEVGRTFDIAVPICADVVFRPRFRGRQDVWWLDIMGRLKPDWTVERAQAHLEALSPAFFKATAPPSYNAEAAANYVTNTFTVAPAETGVSNLRTRYATPLWVLLGATGLVLLITCANLANLMLARATARDREIAVRLAIGASRGRIVRQLLSESLLIAGLGAMGGILLSRWLSQSLVSYLGTGGGTRAIDLTPDWRVFGFIMLVAVTACLVFGLSPALKATRTDPGKTMHAGGRSSTDTHEAMTLRRALVVVQVALSMVLVVGAVLFGRTLRNLTTTDLGFRTGGIVAATVDLQRANIDRDALPAVYQQIVERMRAVPGIEHASEVFLAPLSGATWDGKIVVGGAAQTDMVNFNQIGAEYFRTMDIPLLEGRTFDATDRPGTPLRAVVNEAFARRYFGGKSPVGQTFQQEAQPGAPQSPYHVIGLVKNTKYANLREPFAPIAYLSWTQEQQLPPFVHVVVRSDLPLAALRGPLTQAVLGAAPGTSVAYRVVTNYISESLVTERLMASLSGFFGVLAMLIASIGLYGVMSYMVTRRKVEIGIRMALGANPADVIRMVLKESGMLLIVGVVVGSSLAVAASQYAATLLFGLTPWDPGSFAAAAVTLALVSLLAAWIPARRASRLAPTIALRE